MSGTASYLTRVACAEGSSPSFSGSSVRWDWNSFDCGITEEIVERQGLKGTRLSHVVDTRRNNYTVRPTGAINPSPKWLGQWLPWALGGGTETAPAIGENPIEFALLVDHSINVYKLLGCKIDTLSLRMQAGQLVEANVACVGKSYSRDETFAGAALGTTLAYEPYQSADITTSFAGGDVVATILDAELMISNGLTGRPALGDLAVNEVFPNTRRSIRFTGRAAFDAEAEDMIEEYAAAGVSAGMAASLTLTNSTVSTVFTFANIQFVPTVSQVEGGEIIMPFRGEIRAKTSGTAELTVTNDVTP